MLKSKKKEKKDSDKISFYQILKKSWPCFGSYLSYAFTLTVLYVNLIIISKIIWPSDAFASHSSELGFLFGISSYVMAFSGLIFGRLADTLSRVKLFAFSTLFFGLGFIINGFAPEGLETITYLFFLISTLIRGFFSGGFWPLINSYISDTSLEEEKSQFFGVLNSLFQLFQLTGMIIVAILFQFGFWRFYFLFIGSIIMIIGIIIFKANEPKRASTREELVDIIGKNGVKYEYKLNKETLKETILKPTNIIAFAEGIFTTILLSVPDFLLVAYIQSPPHNLSSTSTALFMMIFGIPGSIFGSIVFAKLSDKLAKRNIKNRIYMIIISMIGLFIIFIIVFILPLPSFTPEEGNNMLNFLTFPVFWSMGLAAFGARSILGLYNINQPPLLQRINLPEAQGLISSVNQFLESIGYGTGTILAGVLLAFFNNNYQITVILTMTIGIIGVFLWITSTKWIEEDALRISNILQDRGNEISSKNKS